MRCYILIDANNDTFSQMSDEALLNRFHNGDDSAFEALVARYMGLISSAAESFRKAYGITPEVDTDDLVQVGLMGLLTACRMFDPEKGKSFKNYAMDCAKSRFFDMAKTLSKKSSIPRESLFSLDGFVLMNDATETTPDELLERKEYIRSRYRKIKEKLSPFEYQVAMLYLSGCSYRECAARLKVDEKKIDNALTRMRKKLSR